MIDVSQFINCRSILHVTWNMTHGTCNIALSTEVEILKNIFSQDADADGSGSVDFSEFVGLMIKVMYFDMHLHQFGFRGSRRKRLQKT